MLGLGSVVLAVTASVLVSGVLELPVWPGISAGLAALVLAVAELRRNGSLNTAFPGRKLAWAGLGLGGLSAAVGLLLYLGLLAWSLGG